ncbi:hypothetical protein GEMRC1_008326 [Eukaryota sp. GEM-RC1]
MSISVKQCFQYFYHLDSLSLVLEHSKSFNYSAPSILLSFVIDQILFSYQLFIHICPIEWISTTFAFNLGLDPIVIHDSTASINQSLEYSSSNHQVLNIFFYEGLGCHEMIISRSTDFEQLFFKYCFKRPFIQSVTPNPFPLTGSLILKGSDFSTNFEFFSITSEFPQTGISNYLEDEIILDIPYICNITSSTFEILLIIGNQTSNRYSLNFGPPIFSYQPVPLSPSGETILLHVTSFVARNTHFVCFVGIACEIEVYSYLETFSFIETFIEPNVPDSIYFLYFGSTVSSAFVTFISYLPGIPQNLKICASFGCFSIFNLPFVVKPSYITPKYFQWLNESITTEIVVEVEGISSYNFSVIQNSFHFDTCQSKLSYLGVSSLIFDVELSTVGNCTLIGSSFSNDFHLKFSVEVTNYLIFPPTVSFNSIIQFYLSEDISDLFITHGSQRISVNHGATILNLRDSSTFITLHRFSQSMNVSFVTSLFDSEIPEVIEVNYPQSIWIDLNQFNYDFDITCSGDCDLSLDYTQNSTLRVSFTGIELGILIVEVFAFFHNSNFNFQIPIIVENPPKFELVSLNVVTSSEKAYIVIESYSHFELNSTFFIDNSIFDPSNVELISSSDSFFVYRFELNLTSLPVFEGEYIQNLIWSQDGFKKHFISHIKFFNLEFSSNDYVSVFEHRDISVDFQGNLTSNLTCSIENQDFFGQVIDNYLVCKNVRIPTFQQHVYVDVYYDQFLLNSFEISGEAFLEEICFISFPRHPLINSSEIISNVDTNLILDGSRCCNVDVSHCAELILKNETVLFLFQSQFDIHYVIVTTNSSCEGIDSDLPFKLIVNNHTLSSFISCKQIPSGYSFASMCEIDLVLPKTSEITLIALEDLYLLEIEFYGYKSNTCFKPFSFGKGVTSLGEVIDEDVHLKYNSQSFDSISEFKQVVVDKSTFWSSSFLTFPTELYSHLCYYSTVSYPTVLTASSASFVIFEAEVVELNPQHLNISIPIICVDPLNFIVDCDGMLSVHSWSFEFSDFEFLNNSVIFTFSNMANLGEHSVWISFTQSQFQWNGTIVQNFNQIFEISDFNINSCDHQFTLDNACTILNLSASLITQHQFMNNSKMSLFQI